MQDPQQGQPLGWFQHVLVVLQWPTVCVLAFWLGRKFEKAILRAERAEQRITSIIERHLPAIHRALAEIRGLLIGKQ